MSEISHDANFCFPVRELENERVKLTPFIPSQHAELFFQGSAAHPELYQFVPIGPYSSAEEFTKELIQGRIAPNPGMVLYAIIDKTRSPSPDASPSPADFAGVIGYMNTSPVNLSTEIGFVIILPLFQRTHVTTNASGLLLQYALNSPSALVPGLGLRRAQWQANEANSASINLAERMGFRREGILRWDRVVAGGRGKIGDTVTLREGDPKPDTLGSHSVMLAMCWDDWEEGGRERVLRLLDRRA
ncbi:acyl-CoA N-acyltransferase [Phlebopus sp. FC_14]|nr:acyl-CoA N-acyltransferase [Phlebopus sp. FC_14]